MENNTNGVQVSPPREISLYDNGDVVLSINCDDPSEQPFPISAIEPSHYKRLAVQVQLNQIVEPIYTLRDIYVSHITSLCHSFETNGYMCNTGSLSVVLPANTNIIPEQISPNTKLDCKFLLLDGRHRARALTNMKQQRKFETHDWDKLCNFLPVTLWYRTDKDSISELEVLILSRFLNISSSTVLRLTFRDTIHLTVSAARLICKQYNITLEDLTVSTLAFAIKKSKTIGDLSVRQIQRYAQVAIRLANSKTAYYTFMNECRECSVLCLPHFSSDILFNRSDDAFFELCVKSTRRRIENKELKGRGGFESYRYRFYNHVSQLYSLVQLVSKNMKCPVSDILKNEITFKARKKKTTFQELMIHQLRKFDGNVRHLDKSNMYRFYFLRSRLKEVYGIMAISIDKNAINNCTSVDTITLKNGTTVRETEHLPQSECKYAFNNATEIPEKRAETNAAVIITISPLVQTK